MPTRRKRKDRIENNDIGIMEMEEIKNNAGETEETRTQRKKQDAKALWGEKPNDHHDRNRI